jgi:hypothetical protein
MYYSRREDHAQILDHLLCLNRGTANTGPEWFEKTLLQLDARLLAAQDGKVRRRIPLDIWWGWQDGMVPRPGQCSSTTSSGGGRADQSQCGSTRLWVRMQRVWK